MATFHRVTTTGALPAGKMLCAEVAGRRVLVANVDGEYFAIDDTCTHEDASLSNGVLADGLVRCPLHGSRFDVRTGRPVEEPAEEAVACHRVRVEGDDVLVCLAG